MPLNLRVPLTGHIVAKPIFPILDPSRLVNQPVNVWPVTALHADTLLPKEHKSPPREQATRELGVRAGGTPPMFLPKTSCVRWRQDRKEVQARELTCTGCKSAKSSLSSEKKRTTKPNINEKQWSNTLLVGELLSRCHWHWYVRPARMSNTHAAKHNVVDVASLA